MVEDTRWPGKMASVSNPTILHVRWKLGSKLPLWDNRSGLRLTSPAVSFPSVKCNEEEETSRGLTKQHQLELSSKDQIETSSESRDAGVSLLRGSTKGRKAIRLGGLGERGCRARKKLGQRKGKTKEGEGEEDALILGLKISQVLSFASCRPVVRLEVIDRSGK